MTKGYFTRGGPRRRNDDRAGRRQVGGGAAVQQRRHRADRARVLNLCAEQRLCRPRYRSLACLPRPTVRCWSAERRWTTSIGNKLKGKEILAVRPGEHAGFVPGRCSAKEWHRSYQGREARGTTSPTRREWEHGSRARIDTPSSRSPTPRSRTGRQGALPRLHWSGHRPCSTAPASWRPTDTSAIIRRWSRPGPTRSTRRSSGPHRSRRPRSPPRLRRSFRASTPRRSLPRPSAIASSTSGRARRRSSRRPWRSFRTSWSRATFWRMPSA